MCARRHGPPRPPWWPANEEWPPSRSERGRAIGKRLVRLVFALLVLIIVGAIIAYHATGEGQNWDPGSGEGDGPPPQAIIGILIIALVIVVLVRRIRRIVRPLAGIVDATYRVADGDYSVRVETREGERDSAGIVEAFNTMTARLESNESQRKQLLSDIAHELRTPLAVIQGTLEGMVDGVYPADREHLAPLMDQGRTITRLLDDLQTMATAEAGMLALHRTLTDPGDLAREVVSAFQPMAQARGVSLKADLASAPRLDVDPIRIRQVLDNLVSNALRHTPEGGSVTVGLRTVGDHVELAVRDTGAGMPQADAERMFERFVKAADSGGSGLGLSIARNLVEAHGGTISATSAPGEGTIVALQLPLETDDALR